MKIPTGRLLKKVFLPLFALVLFPVGAMALPMNTLVQFSDVIPVGQTISTSDISSGTYTHTLNRATDFRLKSSGSLEPLELTDRVDIIANTLSMFQMQIDTDTFMTVSATINGEALGEETFTWSAAEGKFELSDGNLLDSSFYMWSINMTDPDAIDAMEDLDGGMAMVGDIWFGITSGEGSLRIVMSQVIGDAVVNPTPEPMTLLLLVSGLGVGLADLKRRKAIIHSG